MENECIGCGCTDSKACLNDSEPCHWLVVDTELGLGACSSCPDAINALKAHQKEMAKIKAQFFK